VQDGMGSCPICGMDLVKVERGAGRGAPQQSAAAPGAAASAQGRYWCPMHPEVTSDDPEARCEKCGGMKLLPRPGAPSSLRGVPGLVPTEIGPERIQLMGARTAKVSMERLEPRLRTVGFITANESTTAIVNTRFSGWVERVLALRTGQKVQRGEVLATVYSPELLTGRQVYLSAAGIPDPESTRRLTLLGLAPQDIADLTKPDRPQGVVPLRAPITGYIARRAAIPGLYFTPGVELFQIADLSTVWLVADVYESQISRVKVGQQARLNLAAYPGEEFSGAVQFLSPAVIAESRTLQAQIAFKNPEMKLRPGMYGDVFIDLQAADGLVVPTEAVVDTGEHQYLFVARPGGRFEPRLVRLGTRAESRVQVLEGVAEGEEVVTTANFLIDSESRLRAAVETFTPMPAAGAGQAAPVAAPPAPDGQPH
jgi:membrane fusion protein, copper/silver efflux system